MQAPALPTPAEMIAHLNRFVRGQDIAVAVYSHYLSQAYRDREGVDLGRRCILLPGPTGLPKLISGELRIKDAEKFVAKVV
jgi:ATP-dependent protease Clp ATPase subunit